MVAIRTGPQVQDQEQEPFNPRSVPPISETHPIPAPQGSGGFSSAVARGVDQYQASLYAAANALGEFMDIDVVSEWGLEGFQEQMRQVRENPPTIRNWDDVNSLSDFGQYAIELIGEQSPSLAADFATFVGGAGLAGAGGIAARRIALAKVGKALKRKVGEKGFKQGYAKAAQQKLLSTRGGSVALTGSMIAQGTGETQGEFIERGIDAPGDAMIAGAIKGLIDKVGFDTVMKLAKKHNAHPVGIVKSALKASGAEASTETVQTAVDLMAVELNDENFDLFSVDSLKALRDGALAGAIVGGAAGAALGGVNKALTPRQGQQEQNLEEDNPVPESQATMDAQAQAVADPTSTKDTIQVTEGSPDPSPGILPDGIEEVAARNGKVLTTSREKAQDIIDNGGDQASLGRALYGEQNGKNNTDGSTLVVRNAEGVPVSEFATNREELDGAFARAEALKPEGGSIELSNAEEVIEERALRRAIETSNEAPLVETQLGEQELAEADILATDTSEIDESLDSYLTKINDRARTYKTTFPSNAFEQARSFDTADPTSENVPVALLGKLEQEQLEELRGKAEVQFSETHGQHYVPLRKHENFRAARQPVNYVRNILGQPISKEDEIFIERKKRMVPAEEAPKVVEYLEQKFPNQVFEINRTGRRNQVYLTTKNKADQIAGAPRVVSSTNDSGSLTREQRKFTGMDSARVRGEQLAKSKGPKIKRRKETITLSRVDQDGDQESRTFRVADLISTGIDLNSDVVDKSDRSKNKAMYDGLLAGLAELQLDGFQLPQGKRLTDIIPADTVVMGNATGKSGLTARELEKRVFGESKQNTEIGRKKTEVRKKENQLSSATGETRGDIQSELSALRTEVKALIKAVENQEKKAGKGARGVSSLTADEQVGNSGFAKTEAPKNLAKPGQKPSKPDPKDQPIEQARRELDAARRTKQDPGALLREKNEQKRRSKRANQEDSDAKYVSGFSNDDPARLDEGRTTVQEFDSITSEKTASTQPKQDPNFRAPTTEELEKFGITTQGLEQTAKDEFTTPENVATKTHDYLEDRGFSDKGGTKAEFERIKKYVEQAQATLKKAADNRPGANTAGLSSMFNRGAQALVKQRGLKILEQLARDPGKYPSMALFSRDGVLRGVSKRVARKIYRPTNTQVRDDENPSFWENVDSQSKEWYGKLHGTMKRFSKKEQEQALEELAKEVPDQKLSPLALELRVFLTQNFHDYLSDAMPLMRNRVIKNYFPRKYDLGEIESRKEEFLKALRDNGIKDAEQVYENIIAIEASALINTESFVSRVSSMEKIRNLKDPKVIAALWDAGFLNKNPAETLQNYINSSVKRAEYERMFGGYQRVKGFRTNKEMRGWLSDAVKAQETKNRRVLTQFAIKSEFLPTKFREIRDELFDLESQAAVLREKKRRTGKAYPREDAKELQRLIGEKNQILDDFEPELASMLNSLIGLNQLVKNADGSFSFYDNTTRLRDFVVNDPEVVSYIKKQTAFLEGEEARQAKIKAYTHIRDLITGSIDSQPVDRDSWLYKATGEIRAFESLRTLMFSGVASLPEAASVFARQKGILPQKEMAKILGDSIKNYKSYAEMAKDIGALVEGSAIAIQQELYGPGSETDRGLFRRALPAMFKFNGNNMVTNFTTVFAMQAGRTAIIRAAKRGSDYDKRFLKELGTTPEAVEAWADLGANPTIGAYEHTQYEANVRSSVNALNRFVEESILKPKPSDRTVYSDHPIGGLVFHLKSFMYKFQRNVVQGILRESRNRYLHRDQNAMQTLTWLASSAGVFLFFAALSDELRNRIKSLGEKGSLGATYGDVDKMLEKWVDRTGIGAVPWLDFISNPSISSLAFAGGPTASHLHMLLTDMRGDKDGTKKLLKSLPVFSQHPELRKGVYELLE